MLKDKTERAEVVPSIRRFRVQIDFTPEDDAKLEEMKKLSGVRGDATFVRNALRVFLWFLRQRADGWELQITKDGVVKKVDLMM